jgi:hypothetical protein
MRVVGDFSAISIQSASVEADIAKSFTKPA